MALSVFTVITVAVNAQEKSDSTHASGRQYSIHMHHKNSEYGMHKYRHHDMMMKQLNLTDAQKQQIKSINSEYKNQVNDLEKNETITLKDYRVKKANLEKERKAKFQAILTSDQKNKIAQAKKERSEKREMMAQKRIEKMKTDLNLTDAQVSKIQEQRNSSIAKAKTIREDSTLTNEQKKEQLMNLVKSSKESMNNILTADQLKKKEDMRNSRINDMKNKRTNKDS